MNQTINAIFIVTMSKIIGLTIAYIAMSEKEESFKNYKKFGVNYWDDGEKNASKIGYHFIYYYQKKYVFIHKIINILPSSQRPDIMKHWDKGRQILVLSKCIKTFTWSEWISGIGLNAPHTTPNSRQMVTIARTPSILSSNFSGFNYKQLEQFTLELTDEIKSTMDEDEIQLKQLEIQMAEIQAKIAAKHRKSLEQKLLLAIKACESEEYIKAKELITNYDAIVRDLRLQLDS